MRSEAKAIIAAMYLAGYLYGAAGLISITIAGLSLLFVGEPDERQET